MEFNHETYPIYRSRASCLQDILTRVSKGYFWYTSGVSESSKVLSLARRFDERFRLGMSRQERYILNKNGIAKVWLALDVVENPKANIRQAVTYPWVLLSSQPELKDEKYLRDIRKEPLIWRDRVVLRRNTASRWSWYLTPVTRETIEHHLNRAVQSLDAEAAEKAVAWIVRYPMFSGIRSELSRLLYQSQKRYEKLHGGDPRFKPSTEVFPQFLPVMRKIALYDEPARVLVDVVKAHLAEIERYQQEEKKRLAQALKEKEEDPVF